MGKFAPAMTDHLRQNAGNKKDGERGRNRTFNLLIKSQLLCQLSYAPFVSGNKEGLPEEDIKILTQQNARVRAIG